MIDEDAMQVDEIRHPTQMIEWSQLSSILEAAQEQLENLKPVLARQLGKIKAATPSR